MEPDIKDACNELRAAILQTEKLVLHLRDHSCFAHHTNPSQNDQEMDANIMLSYRHLEDARMRLGKVIQAYEGGVSIFDKPATPVA